jgi:hypothetical protein
MASQSNQLEDALIAAHEAGDTEAAELIASEIKAAQPMSLTAETAQFDAARARNPTDPALFNKRDALKSQMLNLLRGNVRNVGLAGRTALNAVTALPLAAMDAGVGVRNLYDEKTQPKQLSDLIAPKQFQGYELPSQTWNNALDALGTPKPEGFVEKAADFVGQAAIGGKLPAPSAAEQAPAAFDPKAMRTLALEKARGAGYVVPPSTTNPSLLNRFLESWGGKTGTAQDAAAKNQSVTDALVKKDLGLGATDDVAEGTLPYLRKEAGEAYKPVRGVGTIRLDSKFETAIDDAVGQLSKVAQKFPKLAKSDVTDTLASLKAKSIDSDTAVDTISVLRSSADEAYAKGEKQAGAAYKAAAKAMEDAIERSLGRRGADAKDILSNFRDARQMIAKTYSAQKALNPELGNFDARKLAAMLNQGKPLSGGMKQAGQFAQAFKEAAKLSTDSGSVRNTDVILGGLTAGATGNPVPLLYPFTRMAARDLLLSPLGQKMAAPKSSYGLPPEYVMAVMPGLLGSQ